VEILAVEDDNPVASDQELSNTLDPSLLGLLAGGIELIDSSEPEKIN
jgi:hypothetical protein